MKVPYPYYTRLMDRLGERAQSLRYVIVDRIFGWAEYHRRQANLRLASLHPNHPCVADAIKRGAL